MSDILGDGTIRVAWATSISNLAAPTVAELEAALDFTTRITPDGLNVTPETADVDNSHIASTFTTNLAGRQSFSPEVTFKRGDNATDDLPWTTLRYKVDGLLVIRRILDYTEAWAIGQDVEVYPMQCGQRASIPNAPNEVSKFTSPMKLRAEPNLEAVVA